MKVEYKSIAEPNGWTEVKEKKVQPCCVEMANTHRGNVITFGNDYERYAACFIRTTEPDYDGNTTYYTAIAFCPFYASPIECEEVERTRLVKKTFEETRTHETTEEVPE